MAWRVRFALGWLAVSFAVGCGPTSCGTSAAVIPEKPLPVVERRTVFSAIVKTVAIRGTIPGAAYVAAPIDANWSVILADVRVLRTEKEPLAPDEHGGLHFLIHSPTLLFAADAKDYLGKRLVFTATKFADETIWRLAVDRAGLFPAAAGAAP